MTKSVEDLARKAILEMLKKFNNRLNRSQMETEEKLNSWAEYLSVERKFTVAQVGHALTMLMGDGAKFMPSAYEIAAQLKPRENTAEDVANYVANEVIEKVMAYGVHRLREAMDALSDVSKQVIVNNTSLLSEIANSDRDNLPTIRAQLRGLAKATAEAKKAKSTNERLEKLGIDTSKVKTIESGLKLVQREPMDLRTIDYSGFLPEQGPA